MTTDPFFSVLVTAYNRADHAERCVRSCMAQTFDDFEVVVVDDASTDGTQGVLKRLKEPRLRVIRHEQNRGIQPARATAVEHARGQWFVILDSDWELLPHSLARLRELIDDLPPGVRVIRSQLRWDDGHVDPEIMPTGVTDYEGRMRWLETLENTGAASDAGHCIHSSVFQTLNYFKDRRGLMEALWELDLARREPSIWIPEVLGLQHGDAADSYTRDVSLRRLIPRLLADAKDVLWMNERLLVEHGDDLARIAPSFRLGRRRAAAINAFLAGERRTGVRHSMAALKEGPGAAKVYVSFAVGLMHPRLLAFAVLLGRRWRTRRDSKATPMRAARSCTA